MSRRIARLGFTHQALYLAGGIEIDLFNKMLAFLPQGSKIVGLGHDTSLNIDYIFVESDHFREIPVNQIVPDITATFTRDLNGTPHCVGIDLKDALMTGGSGGGNFVMGNIPLAQACPVTSGGGGTVVLTPGTSINLGAASTCKHIWKVHHGLFEYYEYCDTCGEKKV